MTRYVYIGVLGAVIIGAAVALTLMTDRPPAEGERHASTTTAPLQNKAAETVPPTARPAEAGKDGEPAKPGASDDKAAAAPAPGSGAAPQLTAKPAEGAGAPPAAEQRPKVVPSFDVVRVNPTGDAVIAGRAAPDSEVVVSDGGRELGRSTSDKRGDWVLLPNEPLAPGPHELSLTSRDKSAAEGGGETRSAQNVIVVVPETGKDIAGRSAGGVTGALALAVPRQGIGGTTVLQKPGARAGGEGAEPAVPDVAPAAGPGAGHRPAEAQKPGAGGSGSSLSLDAIDYDETGNVEISGRAPQGTDVQVYLDNKPIGGATSGEAGVWRLTPPKPVKPGLYKLRVDQLDDKGKVIARIESPFSRAGPLEGLPSGVVVFVQPGNSLWRIARKTYGAGLQYTLIYEANREQIRNPDLIYPGQIFVLPRSAGQAG